MPHDVLCQTNFPPILPPALTQSQPSTTNPESVTNFINSNVYEHHPDLQYSPSPPIDPALPLTARSAPSLPPLNLLMTLSMT